MNSRERILAAISREPVDRIPTDIWSTGEAWQKLRDHFGEDADIMSELHIDGMNHVAPRYIGPPLPKVPAGEHVDYWGLRRKLVPHEGGAYPELVYHPLGEAKSIDDLKGYQWPQADWFDYSRMREQARVKREKRVVQAGYMAPFYFHNLLRGLERSLMDPLLDPELTHQMISRITDFFLDYHRRMFEACDGLIDLSQVTDDLGAQTGPLMSLEMYREFYAPHHKRCIDLCKEFGIKVFHHDDGGCRPFVPLLVDMGIDILNPVQWKCSGMDMEELKGSFGDRICFHGGVENQEILPFGTPEDVRAEVRHCIDALGSDGTGYILASSHNIQVVSPVENIIAMYDEAYRYGRQA